ncbi:hypothetical protein [Crocosphaera sp. XPORK-15E]|uniref:hypothetical protein n=1 Tax=Crocosphaera sp. XPORK-15E TaxID=3110247 RepID=UPI002B1EF353|nr:hypothetical protein [Crocosphaera sp. XPORK-15E]MEA5532917.1 hypothetical protein [Crocosphaera sp. XPORK-15E]
MKSRLCLLQMTAREQGEQLFVAFFYSLIEINSSEVPHLVEVWGILPDIRLKT